MRILIACEFSGIVREAFTKRGHDAWSCDLLPSEKGGQHYQGYLEDFIGSGVEWDMIIAHPECTYLSVSGMHWNKRRPERVIKTEYAMAFVMMIANRNCPRIAIENLVSIISTRWRKPDQIIQPWQFGHPESKKTCLWLKGLPLLKPSNVLELPGSGRWQNQTPSGQNKLGPSPDRARNRSRTYQGIANAMAEQWPGEVPI